MSRIVKQMVLTCVVLVVGMACGRATTTTKEGVELNKTRVGRPYPTGARTTLLAPLPTEPAWQDMAFLAAVPAATVVNNGAPSLVALDASGALSPEIQD